jgi:hypothetical protein
MDDTLQDQQEKKRRSHRTSVYQERGRADLTEQEEEQEQAESQEGQPQGLRAPRCTISWVLVQRGGHGSASSVCRAAGRSRRLE